MPWECVTTFPGVTRSMRRYFLADLDYDDCVSISGWCAGTNG